jgi:hypothetical protein
MRGRQFRDGLSSERLMRTGECANKPCPCAKLGAAAPSINERRTPCKARYVSSRAGRAHCTLQESWSLRNRDLVGARAARYSCLSPDVSRARSTPPAFTFARCREALTRQPQMETSSQRPTARSSSALVILERPRMFFSRASL